MEAAVSTILYEHNIPVYEEAMDYINRYGKVAIVQPTGSGKTYLAMAIMQNYSNFTKLVIGPSQSFLNVISKNKYWDNDNTICLTYQYLAAHRGNIVEELTNKYGELNNVGIIVIDELHRLGAPYWSAAVDEVVKHFSKADLLGLTATPIRYAENRDMVDELFDGYSVGNVSIQSAIKQNIFKKLTYIVGVKNAHSEIHRLLSRYSNHTYITRQFKEQIDDIKSKWCTDNSFKNTLGKHIGCIGGYQPDLESRHIVFVTSISDIANFMPRVKQWFEEVYKGYNVNCYFVHSKQSKGDNDRAIDYFSNELKHNEIKVMLSVQMITESFHFEQVKSISIFRGTSSVRMFIQQIGRGMSAGKESPYIFDFVDNFDNIGELALTAGSKAEDKRLDSSVIFSEFMDETSECVCDIQQVETKINNRIKIMSYSLWRYAEKLGCLQNIKDVLFRNWAIRQYRTQRYDTNSSVYKHLDSFKLTGFIDDVCGEQWYRQYEAVCENGLEALEGNDLANFISKAMCIEVCNQFAANDVTEKIYNRLIELGIDFSDCYNISKLWNIVKTKCNNCNKQLEMLLNTLDKRGILGCRLGIAEEYQLDSNDAGIDISIAYSNAEQSLNLTDCYRQFPTSAIAQAAQSRIWRIIQECRKYKFIQDIDIDGAIKLLIKVVHTKKLNRQADMKLSSSEIRDIDNLVAKYEQGNKNICMEEVIGYLRVPSTYKLMSIVDEAYGIKLVEDNLRSALRSLMVNRNDTNKIRKDIQNYAEQLREKIGQGGFKSDYLTEHEKEYKRLMKFVGVALNNTEYCGNVDINELTNFVDGYLADINSSNTMKAIREKNRHTIICVKKYIEKNFNTHETYSENIADFLSKALNELTAFNSNRDAYNVNQRNTMITMCKMISQMYKLGLQGIPEYIQVVKKLNDVTYRETVVIALISKRALSHLNNIVEWYYDDTSVKHSIETVGNINGAITYELNRNAHGDMIKFEQSTVLNILAPRDIHNLTDLVYGTEFISDNSLKGKIIGILLDKYNQ